jgi:hypothetical protein
VSTYRTGNHWGVTIVREYGHLPVPGVPDGLPRSQLVAVVVNGDWALAERICALLNESDEQELATGRTKLAGLQERADVRRRIAERAEHRPSSLGDGLGYGPCTGCGQLWPCEQSRRECP